MSLKIQNHHNKTKIYIVSGIFVFLGGFSYFFKGKGPLKEYYQKKFEQKNYKNIKVFFLWLEPSDYPSLLGN